MDVKWSKPRLLPSAYKGENIMEEYAEQRCKNCDKECNKGIVQRIDGSYHCADGKK